MQKKTLNQPRRLKQQGFTLIELLIVVAIIGVLAAVGVPQYGNYLDRSAVGACTGELSSYRSAVFAESATSNDTPAQIAGSVVFNFQACAIDGGGEGDEGGSAASVATAFLEDDDFGPIETQRSRNDDIVISIVGGRIVTEEAED